MTKVIIIGNGSIGTEIKKQIEERMSDRGWEVSFVFSVDKILDKTGNALNDISNWKDYATIENVNVDIVFLAIPTNEGKVAFEYISYFAEKSIPVITCEKGALAHYFGQLEAYIKNKKLGFSATVGGGTRMLPYLLGRLSADKRQVNSLVGVLNGTLNYIFSSLSDGMNKDEVLREVLDKKYAEPGAVTFEAIVAGETADLHKKAIIIANVSKLLKSTLKPDDNFQIDPAKLAVALDKPNEHRFLFLMSKERCSDFLSGIEYDQDGWFMHVGLFNIKNISKIFVLPNEVNNALFIQEGASIFSVTGPGAGPEPTAHAMILDAIDLLQ